MRLSPSVAPVATVRDQVEPDLDRAVRDAVRAPEAPGDRAVPSGATPPPRARRRIATSVLRLLVRLRRRR